MVGKLSKERLENNSENIIDILNLSSNYVTYTSITMLTNNFVGFVNLTY